MASLWEAVFADVGVALLAIANALRIQWHFKRKEKGRGSVGWLTRYFQALQFQVPHAFASFNPFVIFKVLPALIDNAQ